MTLAEKREQLRLSLLRFLADNPTRFGMPAGVLHQMARREGRDDLRLAMVETELSYLADKGLAATFSKAISPELRAWRITAEGRDHYAMISGE